MAKYRHRVTGKVRDYKPSYADHVSSLERVDDNTDVTPCYDCGQAPEPASRFTPDPDPAVVDETFPFYDPDPDEDYDHSYTDTNMERI